MRGEVKSVKRLEVHISGHCMMKGEVSSDSCGPSMGESTSCLYITRMAVERTSYPIVYHAMPLIARIYRCLALPITRQNRYLYWKNFLYAAFSFLDCSASFFFTADSSFVMVASPGASLSASSKSLMACSSSFKPWLAMPFR